MFVFKEALEQQKMGKKNSKKIFPFKFCTQMLAFDWTPSHF